MALKRCRRSPGRYIKRMTNGFRGTQKGMHEELRGAREVQHSGRGSAAPQLSRAVGARRRGCSSLVVGGENSGARRYGAAPRPRRSAPSLRRGGIGAPRGSCPGTGRRRRSALRGGGGGSVRFSPPPPRSLFVLLLPAPKGLSRPRCGATVARGSPRGSGSARAAAGVRAAGRAGGGPGAGTEHRGRACGGSWSRTGLFLPPPPPPPPLLLALRSRGWHRDGFLRGTSKRRHSSRAAPSPSPQPPKRTPGITSQPPSTRSPLLPAAPLQYSVASYLPFFSGMDKAPG